MTPEDKLTIEHWTRDQDQEIRLVLNLTSGKASKSLEVFCDQLATCAPSVRLIVKRGGDIKIPEIAIGKHLHFHAIPSGKFLKPFLTALSGKKPDSLGVSLEILEQSIPPTLLTLYVAQQCPHCPQVLSQLLSLISLNSAIELLVVDGTLFPEQAETDKVRSVPTILMDDGMRWTGTVPVTDIAKMIVSRDPAQLSATALLKMIENGEAIKLANMMLDSGSVFPAFAQLLVHDKWPVRLGAMVVFETLADKNQQMAAGLIPGLWDRFSQLDDTVKGDVLHLLGASKAPEALPKLKRVLSDAHATEIHEAAREALDMIEGVACSP